MIANTLGEMRARKYYFHPSRNLPLVNFYNMKYKITQWTYSFAQDGSFYDLCSFTTSVSDFVKFEAS